MARSETAPPSSGGSPTLVMVNRKFEQMHTSNATTCGKTYADLAYCWGANGYGQVGDGGTNDRLRPQAVAGPAG